MNQQDPGVVGVWTWAFDRQPAAAVRDAAAEIEELGFGALWYGEGLGRDAVGQAWLLLSATRRIVVASGIANVALRDPISMATAERALGEAFPGRYLLGLGGHRVGGRPITTGGFTIPAGGRPLALMGGYLDAMDGCPGTGRSRLFRFGGWSEPWGRRCWHWRRSGPGERTPTSCRSNIRLMPGR